MAEEAADPRFAIKNTRDVDAPELRVLPSPTIAIVETVSVKKCLWIITLKIK